SLQPASIPLLYTLRCRPTVARSGFFMAFSRDTLTRYGHCSFHGRVYYISYDWFSLALGVLLVAQLILLPDGAWGDIHSRAAKTWAQVRMRGNKQVSVA